MPQLSVIMPVYNAGHPLRRAIASTLAAMPKNAELIALDDGSSDGSLQLLRQLAQADHRLKVMANDVNMGVAPSLNRLLESCDSPIVARMDADDIALPWRFFLQQRILASQATDVVFATVMHYASDVSRLWPQLPFSVEEDVAPFMLLLVNPFIHATMCADVSVLRAIGGYRTVPSEDYDMWMRLALSGRRMLRVALPALIYRHHASQVTASSDWEAKARFNPATAAVHAELAYQLVKWERPVFAAQRGPLTTASDIAEVGAFLARVSTRAAELGLDESRALKREIEKRGARLRLARLHVRPGGP